MNATSLIERERALRPGASDADCVRAIAARLIDDLGIDEPPIDVDMVASLLGITEIAQDPLLVEAGCLICDGSRIHVRVRQSDPAGRQRFTVCHECAHTFFPGFQRTPQYRCDPHAGERSKSGGKHQRTSATVGRQQTSHVAVEHLCDVAASELLLPRRLFVADMLGFEFGLSLLEHLGARYGASLEATARRLVALHPEPVALVIFRLMQSPRERGTDLPKRLRVASRLTSDGWPFIPLHKSTGDGSPFTRALFGEVVHEMVVIDDVFTSPLRVEVAARAYPYFVDGARVDRVIALLRQPRRHR